MSHSAITVVIHDRANRPIDGQLLPVDSQPTNLGVEVTEVSALQQRVIRESDTRNNVASAKCNLFSLREKLVWIAIELQLSNVSNWHKFFRPDLRSVQNIEVELVFIGLWNDLNTKLPLGIRSILNGLPEIFTVEIGILPEVSVWDRLWSWLATYLVLQA